MDNIDNIGDTLIVITDFSSLKLSSKWWNVLNVFDIVYDMFFLMLRNKVYCQYVGVMAITYFKRFGKCIVNFMLSKTKLRHLLNDIAIKVIIIKAVVLKYTQTQQGWYHIS